MIYGVCFIGIGSSKSASSSQKPNPNPWLQSVVIVAAVFLPLITWSNNITEWEELPLLDQSDACIFSLYSADFKKLTCLKFFDFLITMSGLCLVNSEKMPVCMYYSVMRLPSAFFSGYDSI
jgi:hypothetical protein